MMMMMMMMMVLVKGCLISRIDASRCHDIPRSLQPPVVENLQDPEWSLC